MPKTRNVAILMNLSGMYDRQIVDVEADKPITKTCRAPWTLEVQHAPI